MTEVDSSEWPWLTDTEKSFIEHVAAHTDTEIPDTPYTVGTYELGSGSTDLLAKYVVFRLSTYHGKLSEAAIIFLAHDRSTLVYMPVSPEDEDDGSDTPFVGSVGDYGSAAFFETDEQMRDRLRNLEKLERHGILKRIVTDPKDHI